MRLQSLHLPTHSESTLHANTCTLSQAGGKGTTGFTRTLEIMPEKVHQREPLFIGSKNEVSYDRKAEVIVWKRNFVPALRPSVWTYTLHKWGLPYT
jgi:hypothetical protein